MNGQVLNIPELRSALARVLDAVERDYGPDVDVSHDHYWHLPVAAAFDLSAVPDALTVGQLSDDLEELRESLTEPEVHSPWHELQHAIGLLRSLALLTTP